LCFKQAGSLHCEGGEKMLGKIGVVGCGSRIRGVLKNIPGLGKDVVITAICDPSESSLDKIRPLCAADVKVHADYHALAQDPNVDWVFVGSWNCFHREQAVAALAAGKHVFCEKPLATTLDDCLAIRSAWRASGRMFCLGFVLRYSFHYQKIRQIVQEGLLGKIVSMEFNETLHYEHGGFIHGDWRRKTKWAGTHLLEKCCHDLDLVNWILNGLPMRGASFGGVSFFNPENAHYVEKLGPHPKGGPAFGSWSGRKGGETVNPFSTDKDIIDNQVAIMEFSGGQRVTFHTNCNTNLPERRMYICGTEGTLRADVLTGTIEYRRIGHHEELIKPETGAKGGHGGADGSISQSLRESIINGKPPLADPEDGLRSAVSAFGIDEAMMTGKVFDFAPLWAKAGINPAMTKTKSAVDEGFACAGKAAQCDKIMQHSTP
jgi:predicted dehydrogenase